MLLVIWGYTSKYKEVIHKACSIKASLIIAQWTDSWLLIRSLIGRLFAVFGQCCEFA